jgi:hypothetical protein
VLLTIGKLSFSRRGKALKTCCEANIIASEFPPCWTHLHHPFDGSWALSFSDLSDYWSEQPLRLALGVAELDSERAGTAAAGAIVAPLVDAARPATRFSTHSVVFQECGLLPFDMSKTLQKRCTRDVEEDTAIDEIRVHIQAWHPGSTVLASPELPADAAQRSRVKQEGDDSRAARYLQRK